MFLILLLSVLATLLTTSCLAQDNGEDDEELALITVVQAVWFVGSFVGSIARIAFPVRRKSDEIREEGWNNRFTGTTALTIILALIVTGLAFPMATIPEDFNTLFSLFWIAFATGFGGNAAIIEISEYLK